MKKYLYVLICFIIYYLYSLLAISIVKSESYFMIFMNVFLAFLPMLFADLLELCFNKRNWVLTVVFALLWLLFFPNAPYMITDFIHIGVAENTFYYPISTVLINSWIVYFFIGFGAIFGILMGLDSLHSIHQMLNRYRGKWFCWSIIILISFVSGFGIYLGRVLRLYSWDIINPMKIYMSIKYDFSSLSLVLTLLFALYVFGSYFVFYIIKDKVRQASGTIG